MKLRRAALFLTLLALAAASSDAAAVVRDACDDPLPLVLNLGLARQPGASGFSVVELKEQVTDLLNDVHGHHGLCVGRRPLKVDIAIGSEYEILDWLGQDLIDAALVPDLTLFLLKRDGVDLREVALHEHPDGLLSREEPRILSGRLSQHRWSPREHPERDLEAFRERVLASARKRAEAPDWNPEKYWRERKEREKTREKAGQPESLGYRIVLASHLSSTGFLVPVAETQRWLEGHLGDGKMTPEQARLQEHFWQVFFENARLTLDCESLAREPGKVAASCWQLGRQEEERGEGPVEILFPGEATLRRSENDGHGIPYGPYGPYGSGRYSEHLVISPSKAEALLLKDAYSQLQPVVPEALARLFGSGEEREGDTGPPAVFLPMLQTEPAFGVRTFRFTVDESLRLLRQDEAILGPQESQLALVLPGGGVKAAYQSRIVDELYRNGRYLKNFDVTMRTGDPLDVDYVIGTSGGALLGFFVAQLGENGPWNLTSTLWTRDGKKDYMRSTDIFGWTDLLRYASIITGFLVLCFFLSAFSIPERAPLNPSLRPRFTAWRLRLSLVVVPILLLAPLLVRVVNERSQHEEQVPAIEGMIYALLAMCTMFADQCLVLDNRPRQKRRPWVSPALPLALGAVLVVLPLMAALADGKDLRPEEHWFAKEATFGLAYGILAPLVLFAGLVLPLRVRSRKPGLIRAAGLALEVVLPVLLVLALASSMKIPFFLAGFLLILAVIGAVRFLGPKRAYLRGRGWWSAYVGSLLLAAWLVLCLAWPERLAQGASLREALATPTLDIPMGTLLLCIGLAFLLIGGIAWVYASGSRYQLRMPRNFLAAFFLVLAHAVAVSLVMFGVILALPDWLSPLELTREYWLWLLVTSTVFGLGLILLGVFRRHSGKAIRTLRRGLVYLCSHHPNGDFITRRFLRMAVLSVFSLVWWNAIIAPALYGNGMARSYLEGAMVRFNDESKKGVKVAALSGIAPSQDESGFRFSPTSRFIAPANILEKDGTRYFLFVPRGEHCPSIPRRPASGAQWLLHRMDGKTGGPCKPIPEDRKKHLKSVVFASGSPFPIFPAHRVPSLSVEEAKAGTTVVEPDSPALVDGGYSNNIPVDAARTVSAEQVLIVESSNPLGPEKAAAIGGGRMPKLSGKLVENLGRLPGFLFERSQQVDRLSRQDLFVVSLSPSREWKNWPPLFDFRDTTVERMEELADVDLELRSGMVQSWGRPSFPLTVEVGKGNKN